MDARNAAQAILHRVWKDRGFPVDPVTIARELGLDVMDTDLPDQVSGALLKEAGQDPIIVLHYQDNPKRKRFTCAHELGHFVYRNEQNVLDEEYSYLDLRSPASSTGEEIEEVMANRFAAHLLMPESEVEKLVKQKKTHLEMAIYFDVSSEALKYRLKNMGLL
jgi:Zn-dependent peptidase ImmA (M78 family)